MFEACSAALANVWLNRTFLKRKGGLFKKAHELSVLCSVDVAVVIFGNNKKLYEYSSSDIGEIMARYQYVCFQSPAASIMGIS
jgi:hypothetical protein